GDEPRDHGGGAHPHRFPAPDALRDDEGGGARCLWACAQHLMPVIDIHTHCSPRPRDDPLGVAQALQGIPVGKNSVTNYRGLPAVSYHDMTDFDLQQEVCAKAGITGRIISNPFAAEVMSAISRKPAIDVVKHVNDRTAAVVARAKSNWGLGTLNPFDASHIAEGERCLGALADPADVAQRIQRPWRLLRILGLGARAAS